LESRNELNRLLSVKNKIYSAFILSMLLFLPRVSSAANISLAWNGSGTNAAGYKLYYGSQSGSYSLQTNVTTNTTATLCNLKEGGNYYFIVRAYSKSGMESPPSNEVGFVVPGLLILTPRTNSTPMRLSFPVAAGHWYDVQATTNLKTWTSIWQTGTSTSNNWVRYSDPQANVLPARFYRLVLH
jgi:hypothetical protein